MRASFLLAGPLLSRFGRATMPPPGGDVIGRRRLDPHIHAFNELGASIAVGEAYEITAERLRGGNVFLDEASVMATENTVMAAVLAEGETVLGNAACEPHVQDLCRFLVSLGAKIEGIGSNVLRIQGVASLSGGEWAIGPDHIEVGSFIGLAAVTGGDVTIEGARREDLVSILPGFRGSACASRSARTPCTCRPATGARGPGRPRRPGPEDRGRAVAGVPVGPDVDRGHRRHAGVRDGADVREDVREPAVLRRTSSSRWAPGSSSATRTGPS